MGKRPVIGDKVAMDSMGDDVFIRVDGVPDEQPLVESDSCFIVLDQYGETHIVKADGETWATTTVDVLSDDGFDKWMELSANAGSANSKMSI